MEWSNSESPSLEDFEGLARGAFTALPEEFRALTGGIAFVVQDFPDDDVMIEMDLESEYEILGLFEGADMAERELGPAVQTRIVLYRRPILDYWAEHHETLDTIIRHVLIHEIGHYFGLSDGDMDVIEGAN
ncbi:MAG TPA: metallopeptidase family protein [Rhizomicrobium sp.]|jgi:predicted Zn-dependent protease with MMP-like domain